MFINYTLIIIIKTYETHKLLSSLGLFLILVEIVAPLFLYLTIIVTDLGILLINVVFDDHFQVRMLRLHHSLVIEVHISVKEPAVGQI